MILGLISYPAYAGVEFDKDFCHAGFNFPPGQFNQDIIDDCFVCDTSTFPQFTNFPASMNCNEAGVCLFKIPNLIDNLDTKIMLIDITFDPLDQPSQPPEPTVLCFPGEIPGTLFGSASAPGAFFFDFKCRPNPDWESIEIQLEPGIRFFIQIWTKTFSPVGGELIPIDTTMVLVAGTQMTAAWMIPVIVSGIGIAIVKESQNFSGHPPTERQELLPLLLNLAGL